jgi:hypothetical protein
MHQALAWVAEIPGLAQVCRSFRPRRRFRVQKFSAAAGEETPPPVWVCKRCRHREWEIGEREPELAARTRCPVQALRVPRGQGRVSEHAPETGAQCRPLRALKL